MKAGCPYVEGKNTSLNRKLSLELREKIVYNLGRRVSQFRKSSRMLGHIERK